VGEVVDDAVDMARCDGVDDLGVGESVTVPMEMAGQVDRGLNAARAHDESQADFIERGEVGR
jgi:hypothetical protein